MTRVRFRYVALALALAVLAALLAPVPPVAPVALRIDLDDAIAVALPVLERDLAPTPYTTPDGKSGWVVRLPGTHPIATPAYADGRLFVGGGYGSHEFYCFDAETGHVVWTLTTNDDGPSAAVVEDGCVAFNTESCTVVVADARTGAVLWQEWLGDPLMSQPAVADGRVFIAYPDSKGDGKHRLLCADLRTGAHHWTCDITGDILAAPVVEGDRLYFTCFDGTSFCVRAEDGEVVWRKSNAGTSAPILAQGRLVLTAKEAANGIVEEGLVFADPDDGRVVSVGGLVSAGSATYLNPLDNLALTNPGAVTVTVMMSEPVTMSVPLQQVGVTASAPSNLFAALDAQVGFATPPEAAKLDEANAHLGVATVAAGWAFQGSRGAPNGDRVLYARGNVLNCVRVSSEDPVWFAEVHATGATGNEQMFSPPSLGRRDMYLASRRGDLVAVSQESGRARWMYAYRRPVLFQPALARGNVYVGTADGLLICLKTNDADANGWHAWGGNAQHNKK